MQPHSLIGQPAEKHPRNVNSIRHFCRSRRGSSGRKQRKLLLHVSQILSLGHSLPDSSSTKYWSSLPPLVPRACKSNSHVSRNVTHSPHHQHHHRILMLILWVVFLGLFKSQKKAYYKALSLIFHGNGEIRHGPKPKCASVKYHVEAFLFPSRRAELARQGTIFTILGTKKKNPSTKRKEKEKETKK